jgi:hypothetical protein
MMRDDDRLIKLCAREFEQHVAQLFETNKLRAVVAGEEFAYAPYIGWRYRVNCGPRIQQIVCSALAARKLFEKSKPPWAPSLPISKPDCDKLRYDGNPKFNLIGYYGGSRAASEWDERHPSFIDYGCGLMAYKHAPDHLKRDPELLEEFPPCRLEGLDRFLCWNRPKAIVELRRQLARQRQDFKSRGMPDDCVWMKSANQLLAQLSECYPNIVPLPDGPRT